MRNRPTLSFFLLVALVAIATYGALLLSSQMDPADNFSNIAPANNIASPQPETNGTLSEVLSQTSTTGENSFVKPEALDTTDWKQFTDSTHYLSFLYPKEWTSKTYPDLDGYYVISLQPNNKTSDNIRIYISNTDYFATQGLAYQYDTISGINARNINNMIYGAKYAAQYYTFTLGNSIELLPEFNTMVKSVSFSR